MKHDDRSQPGETRTISPGRIAKLVLGAIGATAMIGLAAEAIQTAAEYERLVHDPIFDGERVAHGDGHPVIVIPGFLGNDGYLNTLREWLGRIDYAPVRSEMGRITGFTEKQLAQLEQHTTAVAQDSGKSVSIIGHSLGGIYARAIARRNPETVRQIITLGSPLRLDAGPAAVPFTAIYSRGDRIVRYPRALATEPDAKNVKAGGCHVGMAFNAVVYRAIAEALGASTVARETSQSIA